MQRQMEHHMHWAQQQQTNELNFFNLKCEKLQSTMYSII